MDFKKSNYKYPKANNGYPKIDFYEFWISTIRFLDIHKSG